MIQILLLGVVDQEAHKHFRQVTLVVHLILRLVQLYAPGHVIVEVFAHFASFVLEDGVPIILNGVVGAAEDDARDFGPAVRRTPLQKEQNPALVQAPRRLFEHWIELVVPSFAALLSGAGWNRSSDQLPLSGADIRN